ncbi:hypothetical protein BsWGS_17156 [Bradybaena similaris]
MGNRTSAEEIPENDSVQPQDVLIEQLRQQIRRAEDDNLVLNQTLNTQGIIIQSLRQHIRLGTYGIVRPTEKCTRGTQTDHDDVFL